MWQVRLHCVSGCIDTDDESELLTSVFINLLPNDINLNLQTSEVLTGSLFTLFKDLLMMLSMIVT